MQRIFTADLSERIFNAGIIAVLVIDDPEDAVPVARTLYDNGIKAMELALRTNASLEALHLIHKGVPEMLAGVGTIIFPEQIAQAQEAGAAFGVSPGLQTVILEEALRRHFPFAPGITTPSELETAISYGCRNVKIFPSEPMGGIKYIKSIYAPYAHLGIHFIPLGGLSISNLASYMEHQSILAAGGSWLAPKNLIREKNWDEIGKNARAAMEIVRQYRSEKQ